MQEDGAVLASFFQEVIALFLYHRRLRQACHPCGGKMGSKGSMADGAVISKKWFAFSRMEIGGEALLTKI